MTVDAGNGAPAGGGDSSPPKDKPEIWTVEQAFSGNIVWVVPVYQRYYEWKSHSPDEDLVPLFWGDIRQKAIEWIKSPNMEGEGVKSAYFGAVIYLKKNSHPRLDGRKGWPTTGYLAAHEIVDGQQRTTTIHLTIAAIRSLADELHAESVPSSSSLKEKCDKLLLTESGRRWKLLPADADGEMHKDIMDRSHDRLVENRIDGRPQNEKKKPLQESARSGKMLAAYVCLRENIERFMNGGYKKEDASLPNLPPALVLDKLLQALKEKFRFVMIPLQEDDDPQVVFASLNGRSHPLSQFDLVRNDIFSRLEKEEKRESEPFYDKKWSRFDDEPIWREATGDKGHVRVNSERLVHSLVVAERRDATRIHLERIAVHYKQLVQGKSQGVPKVPFDTEIQVLMEYADSYIRLQEAKSGGAMLLIAKMLQSWKIFTWHPLILWVDARAGVSDSDKESVYRLLETILVRRELAGEGDTGFNRAVPGIIETMRGGREEGGDATLVESFIKHLNDSSDGALRVPTDEEVSGGCFRKAPSATIVRYILAELERGLSDPNDAKQLRDLEKLSVEHILPKKWGEGWPLPQDNAGSGQRVVPNTIRQLREEGYGEVVISLVERRLGLVNTFGNLTLMTRGRNSGAGNRPWLDKREGLKKDSLRINRLDDGEAGIWTLPDWNEGTIEARSGRLARLINQHWPRDPRLD